MTQPSFGFSNNAAQILTQRSWWKVEVLKKRDSLRRLWKNCLHPQAQQTSASDSFSGITTICLEGNRGRESLTGLCVFWFNNHHYPIYLIREERKRFAFRMKDEGSYLAWKIWIFFFSPEFFGCHQNRQPYLLHFDKREVENWALKTIFKGFLQISLKKFWLAASSDLGLHCRQRKGREPWQTSFQWQNESSKEKYVAVLEGSKKTLH